MDKLWIKTLLDIESNGTRIESRNGWSSEILGYSEKLLNINNNFLFNKIRKLNPCYACAEFLWYLMQTDDTTFLQLFAPHYSRFTEDGIHAHGAYGFRWKLQNQLQNIIDILKNHPESRQAIITMWDASIDLKHALALDKKDLPCTLTHQFLLRDGYLHLVTTMRSNDVWLGFPYDVFCNTQLLKLIANEIDAIPGTYTHNVGSEHLYDKNLFSVTQLLGMPKKSLFDSSLPEDKYLKTKVIHRLDYAIQEVKQFVLNSQDKFIDLNLLKLIGKGSILADMALVCVSKFIPTAIKYIFSPQLRIAVEIHNA